MKKSNLKMTAQAAAMATVMLVQLLSMDTCSGEENVTTIKPPISTSLDEGNSSPTTTSAPSSSLSSSSSSPGPEATPPTTSTTSRPATKKPKAKKEKSQRDKFDPDSPFCTCDLTEGVCDVGCCCDVDCSADDRAAFRRCDDEDTVGANDRYCFKTEFLFANNSQIEAERVSDSLLCMRRNNLEEADRYLDRAPVENVTEFQELESRHKRFLWSAANEKDNIELAGAPYKAGDPVMAYLPDEDQFALLTLPGSLGGDGQCTVPNPVKFMSQGEAECRISMASVPDCRRLPSLDASSFLKGFLVVKDPKNAVNSTTEGRKQKARSLFVKMEVRLCDKKDSGGGTEQTCVQSSDSDGINLPRPTVDCRNVLKEVHMDIFHNGTKGISRVVSRLFVENFGSTANDPDNMDILVQKFKYTHFWITDNATIGGEFTPSMPKSGSPGYLLRKPLVIGHSSAKEKIVVNLTSSSYLTLMPQPSRGNCFQDPKKR